MSKVTFILREINETKSKLSVKSLGKPEKNLAMLGNFDIAIQVKDAFKFANQFNMWNFEIRKYSMGKYFLSINSVYINCFINEKEARDFIRSLERKLEIKANIINLAMEVKNDFLR